jgi:hypothetical protein
LGYPRSGLSRSDFVQWHETDVSTGSEMSAYRGTPEVIGARQNDAIDPTCARRSMATRVSG